MKKLLLLLLLPAILMGSGKNIARLEVDFKHLINQPSMKKLLLEGEKQFGNNPKIKKILNKLKQIKSISMQLYLTGFIAEIKGVDIQDLIPSEISSKKIEGGKIYHPKKDLVIYQYKDQLFFGMPSSFKNHQPIKVNDHPELKKISSFKEKPIWGLYVHLPQQARMFLKQAPMEQVIPQLREVAQNLRAITVRGSKIDGKDQFELTLYLTPEVAKNLLPFIQNLHKTSIPYLEQIVATQYTQLPESYKHFFPHKNYQDLINRYKNTQFISKNDRFQIRIELPPELSFTLFFGMQAAVAIPAYQGYITKSKLNMVRMNITAAKHLATQYFATDSKKDIIKQLNSGGKAAPFNEMAPAFTLTKPIPKSGQIQIKGTGSCKLPDLSTCKSGDTLSIIPGTPYNNRIEWPKTIVITKE